MQPINSRGRRRGMGAIVAAVLAGIVLEPAVRTEMRSPGAQDGAAALSVSVAPRPEPVTWDIPIHRTDDVERWIRIYTEHGRPFFEEWLHRMGRYEGLIRSKLRARGMPEDLVYVALIESGFHPFALSSARALGMWQFMEGTAREQGLMVDEYVDERLDPIRSTEAALDFLASLYDRFDSWYLAAAAYNAGPARVRRVLERHGDGRTGDEALFWKIAEHLPQETQQHIPRLVASAIIAKDPGRFGFDVERRPPISYDLLFAPGRTTLSDVANASGVSARELRVLNPHLVQDMTPPGLLYPVRIPPGGETHRVVAGLSDPSGFTTRTALAED